MTETGGSVSSSKAGRSEAQSARWAFARRLAAFAGLPLLSSLAPFLVLPFVARIGGPSAWAALAIGQSVGFMAAIVVGLGWKLVGPARVAAIENARGREALYAVSVVTRLVALAITFPLAFTVALFLTPSGHELESLLMVSAAMVGGLSPAWYCIGIGNAKLIAQYELFPKLGASVLVVWPLIITGQILLYPASLLLASVAGFALFAVRHGAWKDNPALRCGSVLRALSENRAAAGTTIAAGAYSSSTVAIVSTTGNVAAIAIFVSADKLYRIAQFSIVALGNSLQGWVPAAKGLARGRRMYASFLSHLLLGVCGGLALTLLGPTVTELLFGSAVAATSLTCFWYGLAFLAVSLTTSVGAHMLVPMGHVRAVFWSTMTGAITGVPAILILVRAIPEYGGAMGLALSELVVLMVQSALLINATNRART